MFAEETSTLKEKYYNKSLEDYIFGFLVFPRTKTQEQKCM